MWLLRQGIALDCPIGQSDSTGSSFQTQTCSKKEPSEAVAAMQSGNPVTSKMVKDLDKYGKRCIAMKGNMGTEKIVSTCDSKYAGYVQGIVPDDTTFACDRWFGAKGGCCTFGPTVVFKCSSTTAGFEKDPVDADFANCARECVARKGYCAGLECFSGTGQQEEDLEQSVSAAMPVLPIGGWSWIACHLVQIILWPVLLF